MKITALYNSDGFIVAAAVTDAGYDGPVPASSDGCEVAEFDVPDSMTRRPLDEICTILRVDIDSRRLTEVLDSDHGR